MLGCLEKKAPGVGVGGRTSGIKPQPSENRPPAGGQLIQAVKTTFSVLLGESWWASPEDIPSDTWALAQQLKILHALWEPSMDPFSPGSCPPSLCCTPYPTSTLT